MNEPVDLTSDAAVAELVDARVSGTRVLRDVEVRILSAASKRPPSGVPNVEVAGKAKRISGDP
jgi:hypothetical protein